MQHCSSEEGTKRLTDFGLSKRKKLRVELSEPKDQQNNKKQPRTGITGTRPVTRTLLILSYATSCLFVGQNASLGKLYTICFCNKKAAKLMLPRDTTRIGQNMNVRDTVAPAQFKPTFKWVLKRSCWKTVQFEGINWKKAWKTVVEPTALQWAMPHRGNRTCNWLRKGAMTRDFSFSLTGIAGLRQPILSTDPANWMQQGVGRGLNSYWTPSKNKPHKSCSAVFSQTG